MSAMGTNYTEGTSPTGYPTKKFLNDEWWVAGLDYCTGRLSPADAPCIRYAEVLLNYVEARYEIAQVGGNAFSHSHIYAEEFDADRDEAIRRAREAGVERLLLPAIDSESHGRLFDTVRRYPDHCTPMMGLHPTSINDNPRWREELALVERYLCSPPEGVGRFCAVGEIGLDYYWDDRFKAEQLEAFTKQCRLAATYDLPVAIHTRAAWKDMCRTVETETKAAREKGLRLRGVFHAFAEDADTYRQLKECGDFLFGIGGVVTFKKSRLADTVREMELDDLVLETDCPYLTPVPYRGQRNESGYIPYICNKIAALKGTTPEEVAAATTRNARRMFGFDAARQTTNDHSSPTESI